MRKRQSQNSDVLLTIAEIARHLSLPESTARYYCKRFSAFIPSSGEGRRKRFRPETLDIIKTVLESMRTARTASAVEEILATRFPRNAEATAPQVLVTTEMPTQPALPADFISQTAIQLMERQTNAMEGIALALGILARKQDDLQALNEKAAATEAESAALRNEIVKLRALLHSSEKMQQADMEQLRDWMGRMVRSNFGASTK